MSNLLVVRSISKEFSISKGQILALVDISFELELGELICLIGRSGCGKTTLLRVIAGLERQTSGQILLDGKVILTTGPERGMVFQEPRLFPWLTVEENVAFGMKGKVGKTALQRRVQHLLGIVGLNNFAQAWPHQLSGGMAQKAALARALATNPLILLLDEPFSALDAQTRTRLQADFLKFWQISKQTCIHVTHDIEEALILGQRIIVMQSEPGRIKQIIPVPFPYPRCPDEPEFIALKHTLKDLLL